MRRRLSAVLLAAGLCVSVFSLSVYADETESELRQAVEEMAQEETALEEEAEDAETQTEVQTEAMSQEEQLKSQLTSMLAQVGSWTDEQIDAYIDGSDATSAAIAANWRSVKEELGAFVEVTDAEMEMTEESIKIVGHAKYDKTDDKTDVAVTYELNMTTQLPSLNWEINYPLGTLMVRAALNTVMGLGIVFLTLLFLSWLIGKLHYIPEMVEKIGRKEAPEAAAPAQTAAPAAAAPVAAVEEDLTDDLELVAVITAAIAASGTTSGDGFVVRSIKKANKRNWQRA